MKLGVQAALVDGRLLPGDVEIRDGRIDRVGVLPAGRAGVAAPGLVDIQVNGYAGHDLSSADDAGLAAVRAALAADGVTSFVPTVITGDPERTAAAVARLARAPEREPARARLLGVHLEGPWISPARLGTHPAGQRRDPSAAELRTLLAGGRVLTLTLAPELPGALDLIRTLVAAGVVVLLGHSDATADQARAGFDLGATGTTHLFNAMRPLHHRDVGLAGVTLTRPGVTAGIIADGHHLAAETVQLVFAAMPGRVVLVTDATAAAGMLDGDYDLGGVRVTLAGGAVRNQDGTLAGSAATLAGCVREAVRCGIPLELALHAATAAPADLVRRSDVGRLRPGAAADVTVFAEDLRVARTLVDGEEMP